MECRHAGCTCTVDEGVEFCGDHCREHGSHEDQHACECGHAECVAA